MDKHFLNSDSDLEASNAGNHLRLAPLSQWSRLTRVMCYGNSVLAPFATMRARDDSIQDFSTGHWCRLFHSARLMERWCTQSPAPRDASVLVSLLDLVNQTKIRFHACEGIEKGRLFFFFSGDWKVPAKLNFTAEVMPALWANTLPAVREHESNYVKYYLATRIEHYSEQ